LLRFLRNLLQLPGRVSGGSDAVFIGLPKFTANAPTAQNALDIFRGHWASDLSHLVPGTLAGSTNLFVDPRINDDLLRRFAGEDGRLSGQRVLELGPLEGAHTYQLEQLGAEVTAVEANTEAFFKCLIVKELLQLRKARFLYGDCLSYLRSDPGRFDLIVCCGVLYHLENPLELIELMASHADRVYLWTHYEPEVSAESPRGVEVTWNGEAYRYFSRDNSGRRLEKYWGGGQARSARLTRADLMRACRSVGFDQVQVHEDNAAHPGGPCIGLSLWRASA